jgi:5-methylcytosine-specific restriction endonuclease McrA
MDEDFLHSQVLVLNKNWHPIRVQSLRNAISKVINNRAKFIDYDTSLLYSWDEWLDNFSTPNKDTDKVDYEIIKSKNFSFKKPFISVCTKYNKVPKVSLKLTKRNLLIRDNFCCQYSNVKLTYKTATIDHVIPKSKGGTTTWNNLVICSLEINVRKANKTLAETGLKLLKIPKKPQWSPVYEMINKKRSKHWDNFIKDKQWKNMNDIDEDILK